MSNVINGKMKKSINNFVQELKNKIKDLSDLHEQNRNLSINFERICDIVQRYIMGPPLGLRAGDILRSDILLFSKKDLEEILNLINKNIRLTAAEIAKVLNAKENVVAEEIKKMEEEHPFDPIDPIELYYHS